MSYLYNLYEGSLEDLKRRVPDGPVESGKPASDAQLDALNEAVEARWTLVHPIIANLLDWHDQEFLLNEAAALLPERGQVLLRKLFTAPPLGIEPWDFGFWGALTSAELAELHHALTDTVSAAAMALAHDQRQLDWPLAEQPLRDLGLACVLRGIEPVTPGQDVVLLLGGTWRVPNPATGARYGA
jgi:hypothetical protein